MSQIAVNGQIYSYLEIGTGKDTPVLILHGWGRNGSEWVQAARAASNWTGRKVYLLDLPGFGGSSIQQVENLHAYTATVVDFCKYLDIRKAIVVGHSLGGRVGILLAAEYAKLVEKLILVDPAGVKPRSFKRVLLFLLSKLFAFVPTSLRHRLSQRLMDDDFRNSPALHQVYRAVVAEDLRGYLSRIICPVGLIWGERDLVLPLSLSKVYRRLLLNCNFRVVWGAAHDPHLSHPDQLHKILQEMTE